jgi:predicted Zn-dependent protease
MTCRSCHARFDIRNPNQHSFEGRPSSNEDAAIFELAQSALADGRDAESIALLEDLTRRRVWHYPGHLLLSQIARDKGHTLEAMKHLKAALFRYPFEPMLHVAFADQMMRECALGLARLHYQQALHLDPSYPGVQEKLADIQSPRWTDEDRGTYFISYSEKSAPSRLRASEEAKALRRNEIEFPDIAQLELKAKEFLSVT